jgi:hypothetical protein
MTKLISLRVTLACDDVVNIKDVKPLLAAIIASKGTENLGENGNASGGRIHWGTVAFLQGPDRVVARKSGKRAAQGQGDLGVARDT